MRPLIEESKRTLLEAVAKSTSACQAPNLIELRPIERRIELYYVRVRRVVFVICAVEAKDEIARHLRLSTQQKHETQMRSGKRIEDLHAGERPHRSSSLPATCYRTIVGRCLTLRNSTS